jgi:hypothetical protein
MARPFRKLPYLLLLAVFASSVFGLSAAAGESTDRCAQLGPRVGSSQTEHTEVGYCEKESECCFIRQRSCDFGHDRLEEADMLLRRVAGPSSTWNASSSLGTSSSIAFVSTVRIQV